MVSIKYSREGIPLCTQCEAELNAEDVQLGAVCFKCKREIIERVHSFEEACTVMGCRCGASPADASYNQR